MMSSEQIVALSREAARRSAREGVFPLIVTAEDLASEEALARRLRRVPFIGNRCPRGWKRLNASALLGSDRNCVPIWHDSKDRGHYMQVDASGFGSEDEPSFTQRGFYEAVRKIGAGKAYATTEAGQFQVVVGVFVAR